MGSQRLQFLATAAENEGVASFKSHDLFAFPGEFDQKSVDLLLPHGVFIAALSGIDALRLRRYKVQHCTGHQMVVNDDVRTLQQSHGTKRQQFRIAWPCADQKDAPVRKCVSGFFGFQCVLPLAPQPPLVQLPLPQPPLDPASSWSGKVFPSMKMKLN